MDNLEKSTLSQSGIINFKELLTRFISGFQHVGWCLVVLAMICSVLSVMNTYNNYSPTYSANTTFTLSLSDNNSYYNNVKTKQLETTFPYIITSSPLRTVVADNLGLSSVPGTISAKVLDGTNLFTITVTSSNYQTAYEILRSILTNYSKISSNIIGESTITLISPPSSSPVPINSPSYRNSALLGALIGVIIGLLIVLVYTAFRNTLRTPEEISSVLHTSRLGVVSKIKTVNSTLTILDPNTDDRFLESISSIRNRIIHKCEADNLKSIIFTSTGPNEGKTTMATNIALALAKKNYRTVLIDGDLRNPSVRNNFTIKGKPKTLIDVLNDKATLEQSMVKISDSGLYVLFSEEKGVSNAAELISSDKMKEIFKTLKESFDYVIIDIPPAGIISDAMALKNDVDALVFLVRQDYAKVERILSTLSNITDSNMEFLGVIFNYATSLLNSGYYGSYSKYGYSSYNYQPSNTNSSKNIVKKPLLKRINKNEE